jgi:hypothetical protein
MSQTEAQPGREHPEPSIDAAEPIGAYLARTTYSDLPAFVVSAVKICILCVDYMTKKQIAAYPHARSTPACPQGFRRNRCRVHRGGRAAQGTVLHGVCVDRRRHQSANRVKFAKTVLISRSVLARRT